MQIAGRFRRAFLSYSSANDLKTHKKPNSSGCAETLFNVAGSDCRSYQPPSLADPEEQGFSHELPASLCYLSLYAKPKLILIEAIF